MAASACLLVTGCLGDVAKSTADAGSEDSPDRAKPDGGAGAGSGNANDGAVGRDAVGPSAPTGGDNDPGTEPSADGGAGAEEPKPPAPTDPDPQPGVCDTALLCDGFEEDTPGQAPGTPWQTSLNGGSVQVDSTRAFKGSHSVHISAEAKSYARAYMSVSGAPLFPVAGNQFFGRMMMYVSAAPEGSVHWTNIQAEGPVAGQTYRSMYRYGGQQNKRLMANYETEGTASDCWQHSATTLPEAKWTCMEWHFDGTTDRMELWLDGKALSDLSVDERGEGCLGNGTGGNWYAPTFDVLRLGWEHYQNTSAKDLWIDEVAVGSTRLGCPAP